jgi:hypothetical protein
MTHYELLGVLPSASVAEIRTAWRNKVKLHHPDLGIEPDPNVLANLNVAYKTLSDPQTRAAYDKSLVRRPSVVDVVEGVTGSTVPEMIARLRNLDPATSAVVERLEQAAGVRVEDVIERLLRR